MKRIPILLLSLLVAIFAFADNVSEQQAYSIAVDFARSHHMNVKAQQPKMAAKRSRTSQTSSNAAAYYIFNMGDKNDGFVIVSGDDRMESVLGYSTSGSFDANNIPDGLQWMLDTYAKVASSISEGSSTVRTNSSAQTRASRTAIEPLIKTQWGQGEPYNLLCNTVTDGDVHQPTGCVATAMAQVMYYWKCPSGSTTEIPSYTYSGTTYPSLSATTFDWNNMLTEYSYKEGGIEDFTEEQAQAVAKLMQYCGYAVEMQYGDYESGAVLTSGSLYTYFGFSHSAATLTRTGITTSEWEDIIYNELAAKRPVFYAGNSKSGQEGHQFICDGYDGNGKFHINWGWYGEADGYFSLSSLVPYEGEGGYDFSYDQDIVYNVKPADTGEQTQYGPIDVYSAITLNGNTTVTRESSDAEFSDLPNVSFSVYNPYVETFSGSVGLALYKDDNTSLDKNAELFSINGLSSTWYSYSQSRYLSSDLFKDLSDGTYRLVPVSKQDGSDYLPCPNSNIKYIKAVVSGNSMTLTAMPEYNTEGTFEVTDFSVDGTPKKNLQSIARFTLKNTSSNSSEVTIRMTLGSSTVEERTFEVEGGSSIQAEIPFTPTTTGTLDVKLEDVKTDKVLYNGSITVASSAEAKLSIVNGEPSSTGWEDDSTQGRCLPITLNLKNELSTDYDNNINLRLYRKAAEYTMVKDTVIPDVKVPANGTATVKVRFTNLNPEWDYEMNGYYTSGDDDEMYLFEGYELLHNEDVSTNWLEASKQDLGTLTLAPETVSFTITNKGEKDFNDSIQVRMGREYQEDGHNYIRLVLERYEKLTIAKGASQTLTYKLDQEEMRTSGDYVLNVEYNSKKWPGQYYQKDRYLDSVVVFHLDIASLEQKIEANGPGDLNEAPKTVDVTYTNSGTNNYDDYIIFKLEYYSEENKSYEVIYTESSKFDIATGSSTTKTYTLPELTNVGKYYAYAWYFSKNEKQNLSLFQFTYKDPNADVAPTGLLLQEYARMKKETGLRIPFTLQLSNTGKARNGKVTVNYTPVKNDTEIADEAKSMEFDLALKAATDTAVLFNLDHLDVDADQYKVVVTYNYGDGQVEFSKTATVPRLTLEGEITNGSWEYYGENDVYSNYGLTLLFDYTLTASGSISVEDSLKFEYYPIKDGNSLTDKTTTISEVIEIGGGGTHSNYERVPHLDNTMSAYQVDMYFKLYDEWKLLDSKKYDIPSEYTGIDGIKLGDDLKVKVYDLSGRYIGTLQKSELKTKLKKGVYIVNGKKVVVK